MSSSQNSTPQLESTTRVSRKGWWFQQNIRGHFKYVHLKFKEDGGRSPWAWCLRRGAPRADRDHPSVGRRDTGLRPSDKLWEAYWVLLFEFWPLEAGFPGGSDSKECTCDVGDLGSIPGSRRSPGEGNGNPLQYSCLENPMGRGAWWATVHGLVKSQTGLSDFLFFFFFIIIKTKSKKIASNMESELVTPSL